MRTPGQTKRVLIASESSSLRESLISVVEGEQGLTVIGQAENQAEVMHLARETNPDIVILDPYLPYVTGLDSVRLSRINGLDAAQAVSSEFPDTRVMVLTGSDVAIGQRPKGNGGGIPIQSFRFSPPLTSFAGSREGSIPRPSAFVPLNSRKPGNIIESSKRGRHAKLAWGIGLSLLGGWMLTGAILFAWFIIRRVMG